MPMRRLNPSCSTRSKRIKTIETNKAVYDRRHKCTFAGCEKAFTRSEHLRRHQLNRVSIQSSPSFLSNTSH